MNTCMQGPQIDLSSFSNRFLHNVIRKSPYFGYPAILLFYNLFQVSTLKISIWNRAKI